MTRSIYIKTGSVDKIYVCIFAGNAAYITADRTHFSKLFHIHKRTVLEYIVLHTGSGEADRLVVLPGTLSAF